MAQAPLMKTSLQLNAFPLTFPADTYFRYRIWTVEPVPSTPTLREKIGTYLWRKALRRPVISFRSDNFSYAVAGWGKESPIEYVGDGEKRYLILPSNDERYVALDAMQETEAELVAAMIQQEFNLHLRKNDSLISGDYSGQYYIDTPDEPYSASRGSRHNWPTRSAPRTEVEIYRGFSFRVARILGVGLCLVIDVMSTYIGRDSLAQYIGRRGLPRSVDREQGLTRWVNDYISKKQSVYLLGTLDQSIDEIVLKEGRTVYKYLTENYPQVRNRISPSDLAASVIYRLEDRFNEERHYTAATTLLRPKFSLSSREVKNLRDTPAFPPAERMNRIQNIRRFFFGARFAGKPIHVGYGHQSERMIFSVPHLIFGEGRILTLSESESRNVKTRAELGERKLIYLQKNGPYSKSDFINPFLVYPVSLEQNGLLDRFLDLTRENCRIYGRTEFSPELSSYPDDQHPRNLIKKLQGIVQFQQAGFILLALPASPDAASKVYAGAKTKIDIPSKCFSSEKLKEKSRGDLGTYVNLNTLGMLVENGTRPWGISQRLHFEMHFGFDVARTKNSSLMGASVISNDTGSNIVFGYKDLPRRENSTRREGIPSKIIGKFVLDHLELFYSQHTRIPHSVLFQRDGRFFAEEIRGIQAAFRKFSEGHGMIELPTWATVAIKKNTSLRLRLADKTRDELTRPLSGTYLLQTERSGHLITAGAPSLRQGTPKPIEIELLETSSADPHILQQCMQDIFWLSQLNWSSPKTDISLPITLRFTDQKLERYALELDDGIEDDWDDIPEASTEE